MDTQTTKEVRATLQIIIDDITMLPREKGSREVSLAVTKLQEAKMWLGMHLANDPTNVDLNKERDLKELNK